MEYMGIGLKSARRVAAPAFTLIEMLVVVAIIAILASLLMPALRTALAMGRLTKCLSQQHQLGIGIRMYSEDYSGWYPLGGACGCWRVQILPYVAPALPAWNGRWGNIPPSYQEWVDYSHADWPKVTAVDSIFTCPSVPEQIKQSSIWSSGNGYNIMNMGYIPNDPYGRRYKRVDQVTSPGDTIVIGDTWDDITLGLWTTIHLYEPGQAMGLESVGDRHMNGINVAYCDGHAKWHDRYYLLANPQLYKITKP